MNNHVMDFELFDRYMDCFIDVCHRLYENKYVVAYDGNVSLRIGEYILATPTHINKGDLKETDLIIVDLTGKKVAGKHRPTSELKLHIETYTHNPIVQCIVHAHPLYTTALYRDGRNVNISTLMEAGLFFKEVPVVPYEKAGTLNLAKAVSNVLSKANACILEKHGAVVCGQELEETYYLLETLERLAQTEYILLNIE